MCRRLAHGFGRQGHEAVGFDTMPTEAHYSHWVAEKSIEFLDSSRGEDEPFFLWVNFFDPHHPFVAPQEYLDRYDPVSLPRPVGDAADLDGKPAVLTRGVAEELCAACARFRRVHSSEEIQQIVAANYAMVDLDRRRGGAYARRAGQLGLAENTVVVFTSDHGEMQGDHGLMLKGPMMYEGAVRVPLIIRWPKLSCRRADG